MQSFLGIAGTLLDLLTVVLGFSFVVFIHELGHFLAARWAGIRVLAFALGFGPAALSYRKGMGLRRGSSEREYIALPLRDRHGISPTEYRLNFLPFGGYVKMLGQDDSDPTATSDEPDSYQRRPIGKRMVVISAGVISNVILAACLFMLVFGVGLKTEPAKIGLVPPGSPAAKAVATNAAELGVTEPGLLPGDTILQVQGSRPNSFSDVELAATMAAKGRPVSLLVQRDGVRDPLEFNVVPEVSRVTGLQQFGFEPPRSSTIFPAKTDAEAALFRKNLDGRGIHGIEAGSTLVSLEVGGKTIQAMQAADLTRAADMSGGKPFTATFRARDGKESRVELTPRARLQEGILDLATGRRVAVEHLLGLTPVMRVESAADRGKEQGLRDGDLFVRLGAVEYPSLAQGISEIGAHKGRSLALVVRRAKTDGSMEDVPLTVKVSREGLIGFVPGDTSETDALLSAPLHAASAGNGSAQPTPATKLIDRPGTRIRAVEGNPVATFSALREALREATSEAAARHAGATVTVSLELPLPARADGQKPVEDAAWELSADDVKALHSLGWASPFPEYFFEPEEKILKASGPLDAVGLGVRETQRVMLTTYVTFARLFEGTVKVEHLKGPVGIAHLGTLIASRGFIWLLFFLALISVNLAVINFLPLPIVDGGQFLFLVFEKIRGKPVPVGFQNAATLAGLVLIGSMFLIVTFNDISNLISP
jgi:regulator of sigma E protease